MIFFPLEVLGAVLVYCIGLEKKEHFKWRFLGAILLITGSISALQVLFQMQKKVAEQAHTLDLGGYIGIYVVIVAIILVTVMIPFQVTLQEAVYCAVCAYLSEHMAYCIRILVNGYAGEKSAEPGTIWYLLIHAGVYLISYYVFTRKLIRNGHYSTTVLQSLGLMLGAMFLVIFMSTLASRYHFEVLHAVYALFCCFFILYSQTKLQSQIELQHELDVQQQLWLKQKSQYEMAKENIDLINTKCHDLKHQVAALRTMTSQEKQQKAIDSIEDAVMFYDSMIQTGNEILNTVLTEKSLLCQSHQITLQCMADGEKIQFMDPVDLYTLFGNALDNAIEAVSGLSQEMRLIHLSIQEHARMVFIQIDNPYEGELDLQGGMLQTHKKDKNYHGFGIKSMIQLTEKYHGILKTETEHQIFVLRISIPLP